MNAVSTYALTVATLLATAYAQDDEQSIFRGRSPMGTMNEGAETQF